MQGGSVNLLNAPSIGWLLAEPELAKRLEGGRADKPPWLRNFSAGRAGPQWLWSLGLCCLATRQDSLDPITGGGMTQALITAELLDSYIPDRVSSG